MFKKILFIYLFLERGREGEREGEKHQCVCGCLSCAPHGGPGQKPRHVPYTGNQTGEPLVHKPVLNSLSQSSQGQNFHSYLFQNINLMSSLMYFPISPLVLGKGYYHKEDEGLIVNLVCTETIGLVGCLNMDTCGAYVHYSWAPCGQLCTTWSQCVQYILHCVLGTYLQFLRPALFKSLPLVFS